MNGSAVTSAFASAVVAALGVLIIGFLYSKYVFQFSKRPLGKTWYAYALLALLTGVGAFMIARLRLQLAPEPAPTVPTPTQTSMPVFVEGLSAYKVQPGDNLEEISNFYATSAEAIATFNGLDQGSALVPGGLLYVPLGSDEVKWETAREGIGVTYLSNTLMANAASSVVPTTDNQLDELFTSEDALRNAREFIDSFRSRCQPETTEWMWDAVDAYVEETETLRVRAEVTWDLGTCAVFPSTSLTETYDLLYTLSEADGAWIVTNFIFIPAGSAVPQDLNDSQ